MARIAVVGGGPAGSAAALDLARKGHDVVLLEAAEQLGGLVTSLEVGGTPIERFYHHVFPQEHTIQALIRDLGLGDRFEWRTSRVGVLRDGRVWPFTSPLDLLRFRPLSLPDRVRLGVSGLWLARDRDWTALDAVPAHRWLERASGRAATQTVWWPLLRGKFGRAADGVPAAWMWGRFDQRSGARRLTGERLGYLRGGFRALFDALDAELRRAGADVRTQVEVVDLDASDDGVTARLRGGDEVAADGLLWTAGLPLLDRLAGGGSRPHPEGLGVLSVVLELARPVTGHYWVNVCDPDVPYGALVEHTNLVPPDDYAGRHIVYLARYFTADEPLARVDPIEEARRWIDDLLDRFPHVRPEDVLDRHVSHARYAAPLVQLGHLQRVTSLATDHPRVWAASMAQIYPHDRGMNDGMELALQAGRGLAEELAGARPWSCPVCERRIAELLWDAPGVGETGVGSGGEPTAAEFRPSADDFGRTVGAVVRCRTCGHGSLADPFDVAALADAYAEAEDPVSRRERPGRIETAHRALDLIAEHTSPGRMLDVGCWTGAFLAAAEQRGWDAEGLEPSGWAVDECERRSLSVERGTVEQIVLPDRAYDLIVAMDVLEHLVDPAAALRRLRASLRASGVLYATVPDAGSPLARALGERWWSVLPMHVQYFTRRSLGHLLRRCGFEPLITTTHPKVFSARYYAERLGGYDERVAGALTRGLEAVGLADRLVAPDLHDRIQIVARRRRLHDRGEGQGSPADV